MNIGLILVQAAIAKFLDFTNEMAVNNIRATHLSSPSFCIPERNSCSCSYVHFALNVNKTRSYSFVHLLKVILIYWKICSIIQ